MSAPWGTTQFYPRKIASIRRSGMAYLAYPDVDGENTLGRSGETDSTVGPHPAGWLAPSPKSSLTMLSNSRPQPHCRSAARKFVVSPARAKKRAYWCARSRAGLFGVEGIRTRAGRSGAIRTPAPHNPIVGPVESAWRFSRSERSLAIAAVKPVRYLEEIKGVFSE